MKTILFVVLSLAVCALAADQVQEDAEKTLQKRGIFAVGYGYGPGYGPGYGYGYGYGPGYGYGHGPSYGHGYGYGPGYGYGHGPSYGHGVGYAKFIFPAPFYPGHYGPHH